MVVFAALEKMVSNPMCHGCPFLHAATEFPEETHPGHHLALEHKQAVRARFQALAAQAGAQYPEILADQLMLLMDGAHLQSRMFGPTNPVVYVAQVAVALIDVQLPG
ncbi:TetR family transcriptional regulator C-terminal domain-containing protein [Dictyobacter vulcani]|uniref:TetR family transcriptional regulator C-terminal domain-containing protein n=1 Tax=Dictyobacter vulcani TaxID=2607529 RepID=UPI001386F69F|nr:hypothetical protein [Dictyobacter vulcani]